MDSHIKKIGETHLNAKIQVLNELLEEIQSEYYTTANQIEASIGISLRILNELKEKEYNTKGDNSKACLGCSCELPANNDASNYCGCCDYERDAKADNLTGGNNE